MIEQLIQDFHAKYRHLRIDAAPFDLTACVYSHEQRVIDKVNWLVIVFLSGQFLDTPITQRHVEFLQS